MGLVPRPRVFLKEILEPISEHLAAALCSLCGSFQLLELILDKVTGI